jgi:hypothetical protein
LKQHFKGRDAKETDIRPQQTIAAAAGVAIATCASANSAAGVHLQKLLHFFAVFFL